jgi:hypothetical protein
MGGEGLVKQYNNIDIIHTTKGGFKKTFTTLKEYINLYRGHAQRYESSNSHNVAKHCKFDARGTVVTNTATASSFYNTLYNIMALNS